MLLADQCWLLAHDDTTGASHLPPRIAGVAAAAGIIAELLHHKAITIRGQELAAQHQKPSPDLLQHTITDYLTRETHTLETWLRFFARTAEHDIATRLIRTGTLQEHKSRNILGKTKRRYIPTAANDAAWPTARLANRLSQGRPVNETDQILIAWIDATGLTSQVLWDDPQHIGANYIKHIVDHQSPAQRQLHDSTKSIINQLVMIY